MNVGLTKMTNMRTSICCIAKNEDLYIDEWINYHKKLGFDHFFIYQNNWRYEGTKKNCEYVTWLEMDGECKQKYAYVDFIANKSNNVDFCAFIDVDEFFCFKDGTTNIKDWLVKFNDDYAVGVNWRFFGDNGLQTFDNLDTSVLNRFTRCQNVQNQHIKTILNIRKIRQTPNIGVFYSDPHSFKIGDSYRTKTSDGKHIINGPFNTNFDENVQINHYFCKTRPEFVYKIERGRADLDQKYDMSIFDGHNHNDVEDTTARDFLYG